METTHEHDRASKVDVRVAISIMWIAMLLVFAYVDIFGFYRADVLEAALDGEVATTPFDVSQAFLAGSTVYILVPVLMVVLALMLRPRVNRIANIAVSLLYALSIIASSIGEQWAYYLLGSFVEVVLLVTIAWTAWRWPVASVTVSTDQTTTVGH